MQQDEVSGFRLYHLEPEGYPAMRRGDGFVCGYLLTFKNLTAALAVLDALEGCDLHPPLYERVQVQLGSGLMAWTYLYAREARLEGEGTRLLLSGCWDAEQVTDLR